MSFEPLRFCCLGVVAHFVWIDWSNLAFNLRGNQKAIIYIFPHDKYTQQTCPFLPSELYALHTPAQLDSSPVAAAVLACQDEEEARILI